MKKQTIEKCFWKDEVFRESLMAETPLNKNYAYCLKCSGYDSDCKNYMIDANKKQREKEDTVHRVKFKTERRKNK